MAHQRNRREDYRNDDFRQQQKAHENHYDTTSWRGQTGGQWGEDIHNTPYNTYSGAINTQTNYNQGNYDYSQPDDYGFSRGNQYGQDRVNNKRNYSSRGQQSSYPSDAFSGRDFNEEGADQAYGQSFNNRRNAAYDEEAYRKGGREEQRGYGHRQQSNYGRPTYGGSGASSRNAQPGFDHGRQHQDRHGYYYDDQSGQPILNNQTSFGGSQSTYRGKGPKNYQRTDARILEDVNDRLTDDHRVDASDIEVSVQAGEVVISGHVGSRFEKRLAADIAESVSGVKNVENRLRIGLPQAEGLGGPTDTNISQQAGQGSTSNLDSSGTSVGGRRSTSRK